LTNEFIESSRQSFGNGSLFAPKDGFSEFFNHRVLDIDASAFRLPDYISRDGMPGSKVLWQ
jgi:hypothetical protein